MKESLKSIKERVVAMKYPLQITYDFILEIIVCENILDHYFPRQKQV
jgi:hypothetical protein